MTKMTTEEAFIKVLQMHGIEHAFGIIGSAFMPISDLFPKAGITFWDVAHETNGGLIADGYTRATGKMSMVIDTLFSNAGGGAVFAGSDIQKIFLDVHTSRAHVANNPVSFSRNYGAMQLGVENTDYFV